VGTAGGEGAWGWALFVVSIWQKKTKIKI
jgi:hypothetical protein